MAVESPLYERAKAFLSLSAMPLASEDLAEDNRAGNAHTDVDTAKDTSECFTADESVGQSQTKSGADRWMSYFISDVNRHLQRIESSKAHHLAVREEMHTQVANTQQLNPELLSAWEIETYSGKEKVTIPDASVSARMGGAVEASGDAYLAALEAQRNEVREARAQEILNAVNTKGKQEAQSFASKKDDYVPDAWQSHGDDGQQGGAGGGNGRRGGGGGGGGAGGGLVPTVGAHTVAGSGSNGWAYPTAGEPGSPSNPITDPAQLSHIDLTTTPVNQRMTPNGPVGGHMPADVLNVDDPAWRAVPPSGGGARIAGGVLMATSGVGAAGVAVSHGGGFSGIGGLATGVAGSPLRSVAPAGGVLRPSALLGGGAVGRGAGVAGMRSGVAPVGSGGAGGRGGLVGSSGLSEARSGGGGAGSRGGVAGRGAAGSARGAAGVVETRGAGSRGGGGAGSRGGGAGRGAGSARGAAGVVETRGGAGSRGGGAAGSRGGVAGRGAAGSARGAAGVVGSGSKGRGKKKDEARRRNYEVVRVDGLDESTVGVMGGGAGSADQLRPVCRDAGEDW